MSDRREAWILPSLLHDDSWVDKQGLHWPVDRFGPKGFTVLADERQVQQEYAKRIGAICPPYPTVGSGWWRSRWIHAARAGSVLLCDPEDGSYIGPDYVHWGWEYEAMDDRRLKEVATAQAESLWLLIQDNIEVMTKQIYDVFEAAGA